MGSDEKFVRLGYVDCADVDALGCTPKVIPSAVLVDYKVYVEAITAAALAQVVSPK